MTEPHDMAPADHFPHPTEDRIAFGTGKSEARGFARKETVAAAAVAGIAALAIANSRQRREDAEPRERTVELDPNRSLHAVTAGEGAEIVLLHGAVATHRDWLDGPFATLTELGRVTAIDRPGHGLSRRPRFEGNPRAHAAHLREGLQALGIERPVLVAHSFGSLLALAYAEQFPADVAAVVLVAPLAFPEYRPMEHAYFAPRALPVVGPLWASVLGPMFDRFFLEQHHRIMFWPDEPPEQWKSNYPWEFILSAGGSVANGEDFVGLHPSRLDSYVDLDAVQAPVQVLTGTADLVIEDLRQGSALAERLSNGKLIRIDGTGHMLHHSRPEALRAAVREALAHAERL